jgi:hypothetical protein
MIGYFLYIALREDDPQTACLGTAATGDALFPIDLIAKPVGAWSPYGTYCGTSSAVDTVAVYKISHTVPSISQFALHTKVSYRKMCGFDRRKTENQVSIFDFHLTSPLKEGRRDKRR